MKALTAAELKANCLAILDEVARTGEPVTILKQGRPVAQLVPTVCRTKGYPQNEIIGTVRIKGDIISPPLSADDWDSSNPKP